MILPRLHGDFYGRVAEAVTQGFLLIPLHFVCVPTAPCTVKLGRCAVPSEPGKSLHAWLAAGGGWHGL